MVDSSMDRALLALNEKQLDAVSIKNLLPIIMQTQRVQRLTLCNGLFA